MQNNCFQPLPNAIQAFAGSADATANAMYAALFMGTLTPTAAMLTYGDFTNIASGAITGATAANPVVITETAHGRATGDNLAFSGVVGMTQLNGNTYHITVIDANTYSLQTTTVTGAGTFTYTNLDGTAFTAYTSGGTVAKTYEITAQTGYTRQALASQSIYTAGLQRYFKCADISFGTTVSLSAKAYGIFIGSAAAPSSTDICVGWELINPVSGVITSVTAANPAVVTSAAHPLVNGDSVLIQNVDMIDVDTLNGGIFAVAGATANDWQLTGLDLSTAANAGRVGKWTKLNSTQEGAAINAAFTITIPASGLFPF